ncbi:MAG: response regulator [Acetobacteraceae bacterium]|nr:response regulator [Acetobacteraceae bacterium]
MPSRARPIVAIVDDDSGVCAALRFLLETAGYEVETYESGVQFLAEADPGRLGCLVLDQQMPRLTGLDLLARLRAEGVATPVLLIVSTPSRAVSRRAAELGALRVLEKPLAQDDLLAQVEAAMA